MSNFSIGFKFSLLSITISLASFNSYCLLIDSKVVVKFRNWVGLRDVKYDHAE